MSQIVKKASRRNAAQQTLSIIESGKYQSESGTQHNISSAVQSAVTNATHISSSESDAWLVNGDKPNRFPTNTKFTFANESTITAARRLLQNSECVAVLNFASAKNPEGGFLNGAIAQEEALAVSSALYPTLIKFQSQYYDFNRSLRSLFYSDNIIYSPSVPFFRDENLALVSPFHLSVVTCPAVNYGFVSAEDRSSVQGVMMRRIQKVLHTLYIHGQTHIVLGAYGCGVFRNPVPDVAKAFRTCLGKEGKFCDVFHHVHFAVLHRNEQTFLDPFKKIFADI